MLTIGMLAKLAILISLPHGQSFWVMRPIAQSGSDPSTTNITDTWQGKVHVWTDLRVVVKISRTGDAYRSVFYQIDLGGTPFPIGATTLEGSNVKLTVPGSGGFEGRLSPDGNSIAGVWTLGPGPNPLPLTLTRATPDTEWVIPKPPPQLRPMALDANPSFEVATIKPTKPGEMRFQLGGNRRRFVAINVSPLELIKYAYDVHPKQIVGAPAWAESERFDIAAEPDGEGAPSEKQWKTMCQKLLGDRFNFRFHRDQAQLSVYALTATKTPKLKRSTGDSSLSILIRQLGTVNFSNAGMNDLAAYLQQDVLDRPVVDKTGIDGKWDFGLRWTPDTSQFAGLGLAPPPPTDSANAPPSLYTAIQEEIGLKLSPAKAHIGVMVIDRVEQPSGN